MKSEATRDVELPEWLVTDIEDRLSRTEFESADEYITFAMGQVLANVEDNGGETAEDEVVEARLQSLGYME